MRFSSLRLHPTSPDSCLWWPVVATFCNLLIVLIFDIPRSAKGQPVLHETPALILPEEDCDGVGVDEMADCLANYGSDEDDVDTSSPHPNLRSNRTSSFTHADEADPKLQKMPGADFEAYVRADISSFYRQPPGTMTEVNPKFNGQAGKFVNQSPERVALYWLGPGNKAVFSGTIEPWAAGGTATFAAHRFRIATMENPGHELCVITIQAGTSVYYYDPYSPQDLYSKKSDPARCVRPRGARVRSLNSLSAEDRKKYDAHKYNFEFAAMYKNFTGSEWLAMYPRNKPTNPIWRADYFGQEHKVVTTETHFHTFPPVQAARPRRLSIAEMRRDPNQVELPLAAYRHPGTMKMTLRALSCEPRAFEIKNFLSDVEVDHILALVKQYHFERSSTGGHQSDTRTSSTAWVPRASDPVLNAVYRRAADALRLDEALLRIRDKDELPDMHSRAAINEDLQVVHYDVGQEYTAHHDFGYPQRMLDSPSRSINLCMYLNDVPAGGETAFPRWRNAETGEAIKVKPEKGKAMIFYMVNPDGNLDDLTQHAALPVIEGEKYFANLWIHSPFRA